MAVTIPQESVLTVLGEREHTTEQVARRTGYSAGVASRVLDGLFRRSFVTIAPSGRWARTARGARALSVSEEREAA